MPFPISTLDAVILGVVEGITEFLPVSSTGHLIVVADWLHLPEKNPGVTAFLIVIQFGALLAVIGLYRAYIATMISGIRGRNQAGARLAGQLVMAFMPAVVVALAAGTWIRERLFGWQPVAAALVVGGVAMIAFEAWRKRRPPPPKERVTERTAEGAGLDLTDMTYRAALIIGCAQCLSMWPGTSRSMVTIIAAMLLGYSPRAAAEFSFLLALPTLGAACAHDLWKDGAHILAASGVAGLMLGFWISCAVSWVAVKGFLAYLRVNGLAAFGWYRIALAAVVWLTLSAGPG